ncbi:hypothetical protein GPECTOR_53g80 [Gonium pectorale]|uniref:Uncharacterized protein n=1 Tax=Gonium pectorale TaxID=33097 RepID=A0A150G6W9_GONPE|nr:hypothetical protein GPECTOR_53g80 [Gonium pectorale]|eukprot:KXZ45587.1 hypothetical protein GPECTOR_53g80 [Gonium pectorale]
MRVKSVLETVLPREGLSKLPLFAMGGSSGGSFVLSLPIVMPGVFKGIVAQIGGVPPGVMKQYQGMGASTGGAPWPPTMFVHMPRDRHLAALVALDLQEMKDAGVPTAEIKVMPQPLTPLYLAQRCAPEVDEPTSRAAYKALRSAGILDERGYLLHNPRGYGADGWRAALQKANVPGLGKLRLRPDASPIAEELNLLWAGHELSSETTTDMLNWLESVTSAGAGAGTGAAAATTRGKGGDEAK